MDKWDNQTAEKALRWLKKYKIANVTKCMNDWYIVFDDGRAIVFEGSYESDNVHIYFEHPDDMVKEEKPAIVKPR